MAAKTLPQVPPVRKTQPLDHTGHLAAGRLKAQGEPTPHIDAINYLLDRAQALVEIIKESSDSKSEDCVLPTEYLLSVLDILREDVEVARRIANELDDLYRPGAAPAKAD
jgi:hypothetical protein